MSLAALTAACDSLSSDARYAKKTRALAAALKTWATEQESETAMAGTFTWAQPTDPTSPPTSATPTDGETWLDTSLVPTEGYFTLWVWFDANGGWCNELPPLRLLNLQYGYGSTVVINNDGSVHVAGLPTADPNVSGQLWNDAGNLKVSAG